MQPNKTVSMGKPIYNSENISCPIIRTALGYVNPVTVERQLKKLEIVHDDGNDIFQKDTVCVITGGSNGLGLELTKLLIGKPCRVVIIIDIVPPPREFSYNPKIRYFQCDISEYKQIQDTYSKIIKYYNNVSILINNAGKTSIQTLFTSTDQQIDSIMKVNFLGPYQLTNLLLPHMLEKGRGCIVNVASVLGEITPARVTTYGASKACLLAFHKSLSNHVKQFQNCNIHTILVCPGKLETKMFEKVGTPSKVFAPDVNPSKLASRIVNAIQERDVSAIRTPYYANLLPLYSRLEWPYVSMIKKLSGMNKATAI